MLKTIIISLVVLFISGCSQKTTTNIVENDHPTGFEKCTEPRPEIFLAVMDPVCAKVVDGSKIYYDTISNDGVACGDKKVVGYTKGKCSQEVLKK